MSAGPRKRSTSVAARGEPMVWLMAMSLSLCALMIAALLGTVVTQGVRTFWPRAVERLTLADGSVILGIEMDRTHQAVGAEDAALAEAARGDASRTGLFDAEGRASAVLVRVANRDYGGVPFVWVPEFKITSRERPSGVVFVERAEWGPWIGEVRALVTRGTASEDETVREEPDAARLRAALAEGAGRRARLEALSEGTLARLDARREALRVRGVEIRMAAARPERVGLGWGGWGGLALAAGVGVWGAWKLHASKRAMLARVIGAVAVVALAGAWLERPWAGGRPSEEEAKSALRAIESALADLEPEYNAVNAELSALREEDGRHRIEIAAADGKLAPEDPSKPDEPIRVSRVYRMFAPNDLSWGGKFGVFLSRWGEFLSAKPRDANTAGGVFPVIFGTVSLTILLSIVVVPLGVVAALYLREYARQGVLTSVVRIAVNNLAGVPSIVYGVFGVGFFCYALGGYIDKGPEAALPRFSWWFTLGGLAVAVVGALTLAGLAKRPPARESHPRYAVFGLGAGVLWLLAAGMVVVLVATTPYFGGWFVARQPTPTFGTKGILWGALTLALLTLPVVIVATEEAVAAVPRSMREGSYGCGASKWQTIVRIVLPQAMPGIMTGAILAMARGAGEVAPLMLVGAVKLAPELPVGLSAPFVHLERSFMHLGFHIYDLGFQSPDADAARPLVWTTTLLLIAVVLMLNLAAVFIRARLRARLQGSAV